MKNGKYIMIYPNFNLSFHVTIENDLITFPEGNVEKIEKYPECKFIFLEEVRYEM